MQTLKRHMFSLLCACLPIAALAVPAPIVQTDLQTAAATTYVFYVLDSKQFGGRTPTQVQNTAVTQLAASSLTPCFVTGDLNTTNVNCGNGAVRFGSAELSTYNLETDLPVRPTLVDAAGKPDKAFREAQGADFLAPNLPTILGDQTGRVVTIHFNQRVAQFGMFVGGPLNAPPTFLGVQFIVNRQATPIQTAVAGVGGAFVGIQDPHGFTDITIVPVGLNRTFVSDRYSVVPLADFQR